MICSFCGGTDFSEKDGCVECTRCGSIVYHEGMKIKTPHKNNFGHLSGEDIEALKSCEEILHL